MRRFSAVFVFCVFFAFCMVPFTAYADSIESFKEGQYVYTTARVYDHYYSQNGIKLSETKISYKTITSYINKIENGVVELINIDENGEFGKRKLQKVEALSIYFHSKTDADRNTAYWNSKK